MSRWGVYDEVSPVHVLPCDENGYAINGHAVSDECWCSPVLENVGVDPDGNPVHVIVHQDKGRGGLNS